MDLAFAVTHGDPGDTVADLVAKAKSIDANIHVGVQS